MIESATFAAWVSLIRSSVVGGSSGQARIAMFGIGTGRGGQFLEHLPCATGGGLAHLLHERHGVGQ
jgi:hypothetical protein